MAHRLLTEIKEEVRVGTLPYLNLAYTLKGVGYAAVASLISLLFLKINTITFLVALILLNAVVYPLAHNKTSRDKFEGGNLSYDKYLIKRITYFKKGKKVYIRRINK